MRIWIPIAISALSSSALAQPADSSASRLIGTWRVEFLLDSAGALSPRPTSRVVRGVLSFGSISVDSAYAWRPSGQPGRFGRSALDFSPFFGRPVARDVSTTVFGPFDADFLSEAIGGVWDSDSVRIKLIPRLTHGSIDLSGRLMGDSILGIWLQVAYCCGAYGRFVMHLVSRTPPVLALPPRPRPPPPLDTTVLGSVRVRVWDEVSRRFIRATHALEFADGSSKSAYHTGEGGDGWGKAFWLAPGTYVIAIRTVPCGDEEWVLREPLRRTFVITRGARSEVSITLDRRALPMGRAYYNRNAAPCPHLP